MAAHVIRVPDLGEGIAEVELVVWHVAPGDAVVEDQALADVMTDKASVEIPSPVAGKVLALGGEVGQMLAVGSELISIEVEDEAGSGDAAATGCRGESGGSRRTCASRRRRHTAAATGIASIASAGTGAIADAIAAPAATPAARAAPGQRPIASPAVRARAWELGIDLEHVSATGTAGRIVQADLDAHLARGGARSSRPAPARAAPASDATHAIKIVGLRRKIAQKMQESKRRIPHYSYVEEVDVTEVEALRAELNAKWGGERGRLTLLAFLVRAVVLAVREFPMVNARFDDETGVLTRHDAVHVGIATQTPAGLVVPVVRDAQANDLWANGAEIARLADAARSGKAVRDELTGSTITITSLGGSAASSRRR